jgi:hypothetical protein
VSRNLNSVGVPVTDADWVEVLPVNAGRKSVFLQNAVGSDPVLLFFGPGTPDTADSVTLAAGDKIEMQFGCIGPVQARCASAETATVIKID